MEEIVKRIAELDAEIKRREKSDHLARYNSGRKKHLKQLAFHKCKKRNRWVFGGNRSGKTECGAVECVYMARGIHPYRKNRKDVSGWVVSLSTQVQRDVAQKKILHYEKKKREEKYRLIRNGTFRSELYAFACDRLDRERDVKVGKIRENLLFFLLYCNGTKKTDGVPYSIDYSLSYVERAEVVKQYYMTTYSDGRVREVKYRDDGFARSYLGEYYKILLNYFAVR